MAQTLADNDVVDLGRGDGRHELDDHVAWDPLGAAVDGPPVKGHRGLSHDFRGGHREQHNRESDA
jgi:hypothetical protein